MARRQTWCWLLVAAALAFGLWRAIDRRWLCDDAFISFRYARNLADGLGLVFNAEERVEGFSNFLWTLLCALATALGGDPVAFAQWLGIACFAATVPVTVWAGRRLLPDAPCLPLAAASVALHAHLQEFASCGLETAAFVLVVTALTGVVAGAAGTRAWLLAGLLAAIAALLRPDGAIFGLLGGCAALAAVRRQRRWRPLAYVLPGIGLFVPFLLWRYVYYGELLPNTFYAKSADEPYAGQGLRYCWLFFTSYWVLLPALPALVVLALRRGSRRAGVWLLGCTLAYCGFVVWVGGDFMFARFLLPVMPLLYLALELAARTLLPARFGIPALVLVAVATLLWQPHARLMGVFQNGQVVGDLQSHRIHGIGDEREQYPPERVADLRRTGREIGVLLGATGARVLFFGTQAMLVYEAGFVYALEGSTGLTDRTLAHSAVAARGTPGHEKSALAQPQYVLQRRVHFMLERNVEMVRVEPWRAIELSGLQATIVHWDRALMQRLLGRPGVVCRDFEALLDDYLAALPQKTKAEVQADLGHFNDFYFAFNDDQLRRARFDAFLRGR